MTAACFQALLLFSVNICSSCFSRNSILLTETVVLSIQMYLAKHMLRAGQTHGSHSRAFVVHLSE